MIEEALSKYNFKNPKTVFIRHNENMTYAVTDGSNKYLMRIHKAAEGLNFSFQCGNTPRLMFIESEIRLLERLYYKENMKVQSPVKNKDGELVTRLTCGEYVTVLSWLDGEDLSNTIITEDIAYQIGKMIGRLHNQTSKLPYFNRFHYDEIMSDRIMNEINIAYELRHIEKRHYNCIISHLNEMKKLLINEKKKFILIHADLSKSNLIYRNDHITPIDFSLSGYTLPEMDLADMSVNLNDKNLTSFMLNGYQSVCKYHINEFYIDVYRAFSIIIFIAYHHNRWGKDAANTKSLDRWCDNIISPVKF